MSDVNVTYGKDLEILKAIYRCLDSAESVSMPEIMDAADATQDEVWYAVDLWMKEGALSHNTSRATGGHVTVSRMHLMPHGKRRVGAWPSEDHFPEVVVRVIEEAAEREPDPDRKQRLRDFGKFMADTGGRAIAETLFQRIMGGM